jgi:outer membrane protein assembly factor BamE
MPRLLLLILLGFALSACAFKPEIRQGNFITDDMIAKLKPGMTPAQVEFVMGRAMVQDPFHPDRWDYVTYTNFNDGTPIYEQHIAVIFKDGKVDHIEQSAPAKPSSS